MTKEDFYNLIEKEVIPECIKILKTKGEAYTLNDDRLMSFKKNAKLIGISPERQWLMYFTKHFDAIVSYVNENYSDSEPIETRIHDMINYLLLFFGLIYEKRNL